MSYIGNQPTSVAFLTDQFSGTGSQTAFTLSAAPANTASILVAVSGVLQDPSTYSVSGLTLTFSAAPPSATANISVRYLGIPASGVTTTAYRTVTEFTATASQTTFTPPSYTAGFINVYRNGVRLGSADYTASNGTTVVLASGATVGDLVTTESYYVSSVLNAIPATAGAVTDAYITSMAGSKLTGTQSIPKATLPTGSVLQVVSSSDSTERNTTSTSFGTASNTLSVSITPTSSTSKIYVVVSTGVFKATGGSGFVTIYRNSTNLGTANGMALFQQAYYSSTCISYLDSPATTSATTYQLYFRSSDSNPAYIGAGGVTGSLTAFEVAA